MLIEQVFCPQQLIRPGDPSAGRSHPDQRLTIRPVMRLALRYPLSLAVVLAALAATAAVFTFARPQYGTPDQRAVDLARVHHFSRAVVWRTFAAHGIQLRYSNDEVRGLGPLWLSPTPMPVPTDGLYVIFGGRSGSVSWGPTTSGEYDQPVGNVLVHYGGSNAATLAAAKSAVADLNSAAR